MFCSKEVYNLGEINSKSLPGITARKLKGFPSKSLHFYRSLELSYKYIQISIKSIFLNNDATEAVFNDPDIRKQWYFVNQNASNNFISHHLNYLWENNISGKGVTIALLSGGIDGDHVDLKANYDTNLVYNFLTDSKKITPSNFGSPTEQAGIIAAVSNNMMCGTGAAPSSRITNLQVYGDEFKIFDTQIMSNAILYMSKDIQIYVIDSTYDNILELNETIDYYFMAAAMNGHFVGRSYLGSIFVTGSGQFQSIGNNCAFRGYQQLPEVFVFSSISSTSKPVYYSERCTAILAAALSSDTISSRNSLYSTTWGNLCEESTFGTSASASIAAGIIALLIGHNPKLTARQVMILIVLTSKQYDMSAIQNSAGFSYSYSFGFGMLDSKKLILSSNKPHIKHLGTLNICKTFMFKHIYKLKQNFKKKFYFYTSGCYNSSFCVTKIEQVFVSFTINSDFRNSIQISIESPSETKFTLIEPRDFDRVKTGFNDYRIKILGYFGERPIGVWKLLVSTSSQRETTIGRISLEFYGTCTDNGASNVIPHLKVVKYISKAYKYKSTAFFIRMTSRTRPKFETFNSIDIFSFSKNSFPLISRLNGTILKH